MKKAEQGPAHIEDTELVLEELFRHTPVGVVLTDMFGTVLDANAALCAMLGYDRTELIGCNFTDVSHPDDVADVLERTDDLRFGRTGNYVVNRRYLTRTGEEIQAKVSVSIVYSKTREPVCGIGIIENITERVAMEAALRQSEMRYRRVLEDQTELITRCLPDGTLTFVNAAFCRYNNATAGQLLGTSLFACMNADEQEMVRAKFAALSPSNAAITDQHWVIAPGGVLRWHEWTDRGFFDADGRLVEIQSVGRDLTEQHEAQQKLVESEARYRRLFNSLPVAVWENDWGDVMAEIRRRDLASPEKFAAAVAADPKVYYELGTMVRNTAVNPAALAMAGVSTQEEFERWLATAATRESAIRWSATVPALMFGDSSFIMGEYTLVRANGEPIDVLVRIARAENWGESWMTYPIAVDVTERKRIERELMNQQELTERAEAAAHFGSWEWKPADDSIYGSAEFWCILDGSPDGAKQRPARECIALLHPEDAPEAWEFWTSLQHPSPEPRPRVLDVEYRVRRPDGSLRLVSGQTFATYDETNAMVRAFGILRDVTDVKRAEEELARHRDELVRADKMITLGILVSGMAHEINNPNHTIALNAPLVRDAWREVSELVDQLAAPGQDVRIGRMPWAEARPEVTDMVEDIETASERIRYIVSELRNFALDQDPGDRQSVSVNDVVQSAARLVGKQIARATRHFDCDLPERVPPILGNARRLEQVVVNLIMNACQALEHEEQAIRVTTGVEEGRVFVRVRDEGHGIAPEHLPNIRTPFFTTKRAQGGTGLGVPVSDRIAKEHGGELTFESELGGGTTATLWLPPAKS
ncbi:MAG TPA: PAS domain S-box protein [Thermoanaerobaculia bacterium]